MKRLDRIDRYAGVNGLYKDFWLTVVLPDKQICCYQTQVMAVTAVGLLSRWCPQINIVFSDSTCLLSIAGGCKLSDFLLRFAIDNSATQIHLNKKDFLPKEHLYIGSNTDDENGFWIDSKDWLSGFGYGLHAQSEVSDSTNPLGAGFAACLGVAELFRLANGHTRQPFSKWHSLIDFGSDIAPQPLANHLSFPSQFNPGRLFQVGAGAVGSNLLFFVGLTDWQCDLTLVDFDTVSIENCSNSLLFNEGHENQKKVTVCESAFSTASLRITPFDGDYSDYKRSGKEKEQPDILLCFANERNIWKDIQYNLPPLSFHATTTTNWGINFGRHIPLKEWCLVCRFENDMERPKGLEFACSTSVVKNEQTGEETLGMLPFLSAASALLVLTEMAKLPAKAYPLNFNFQQFWFSSREGQFLALPNKRKPCFVCGTQTAELYSKIRGETKYWCLNAGGVT